MARIKFSALVSDASGSVGGNIFSRNANGTYVKAFTMPHNPNTSKQQAVRTQFANLTTQWKSLTVAQQQLWTDAAPQYKYNDSLGETRQYTGQQLFNKINNTLAVLGLPFITSPLIPKIFTSTAVSSLTMTNTAGVLTTADLVISAVGTADESIIVSITPGLSNGITRPGKNLFRQVTVVADASLSATIDLITAYQALYGDPELGAKIFVRADIVNRDSGQRLMIGQAVATVTGT